jgi:hypothetical protein
MRYAEVAAGELSLMDGVVAVKMVPVRTAWRRWLMNTAVPLVFTGLLGLGAAGASVQTAPEGPAGNQAIPELDTSRGVIKPQPGVDPEIVKPAPVPEPNSTPVVPRLLGCRAIHPVPSKTKRLKNISIEMSSPRQTSAALISTIKPLEIPYMAAITLPV